MPVRFDLDPAVLAARHRELSRALHPDRYAGRGASERRQALGKAIEVNEAFRLLKDPVRRAEALLGRLGVETGEQAESQVPPDFLMEIMELREGLSELRRAGDAAGITALSERVELRHRAALERLGAGFRDSFAEPASKAKGEELLPLVAELRYYARFFNEAHAVLDDLA